MTGKSRVTDAKWHELHQRALAGETLTDLDDEIRYTRGSVRKMLTRRFGYAVRTQAPPISREVTDAIHERLQRGESLGAIAREMGLSNSSNLYKVMMNRYGYKAEDIRYRAVWASTLDLSAASATDLAYLAGIIDGEGTILHQAAGRSTPIWTVKFNMTDRPLVEWVHSFGGTFNVRPPAKPGHKEQYAWAVNRQLDVLTFLEAILPYLRVKRARAEEALADLRSVVRRCDWTEEEAARRNLEEPEIARQRWEDRRAKFGPNGLSGIQEALL